MARDKSQPTILGFFAKASATPAKKVVSSSPPNDATPGPLKPVNGNGAASAKKSVKPTVPDGEDESPTRSGKRAASAKENVRYVESDDEDDGPLLRASGTRAERAAKRRKLSSDESEDEFKLDEDTEMLMSEVVVEVPPSSPPSTAQPSTAQQWKFDPDNIEPAKSRPLPAAKKSDGSQKKKKEKAHTREPEQRYLWLANLRDADRNPPDHPDYDPRTVYVPPLAWEKFSPFEKQYWEIKQKFWDTIVFFKKGKFYELYENDATIGHQLFDLKLTDRVNMRMVGVPEASLDYWANQFVAKGYKIARVDQMESALAKEMRERDDGKKKKDEKVIRRELACVLTAGTLVEGSMLQDDMSTYCVAIKVRWNIRAPLQDTS
jgi:DNA mismatch repair protein MSH6